MSEQKIPLENTLMDLDQATNLAATHLFYFTILMYTFLFFYVFFYKVLDSNDRQRIKELPSDIVDKIKSILKTRNKNKILNEIKSLNNEIEAINSKHQFKQITEKSNKRTQPKKVNKQKNRNKVVFNSNLYKKGAK